MPLKFCTVHASLKSIQGDGLDQNREPDRLPLKALKFVFVLDVDPKELLRDNITDEIYVPTPIEGFSNEQGILVDKNGVPGVLILAANNPDLAPSNGFTCTVTITSPTNPEFGRRTITFVPYADTEAKPVTQLASVVRVPASPGTVIREWQTAVDLTTAMKAEVEQMRDQVIEVGGTAGQSAYQIAVAKGFVGTEAEWVASLQGTDGTSGTITTVTATALAPNAAPTVTVGGTPSARTIALGIPKGDPGTDGVGSPGPAGTITAVTATALAAGATPTVTLGGTASARTIALGIPSAPANSGTEIAEADIVDETDNTAALVTGRRVAAAVAAQTGDHQFVYYDPINGWDAPRQSARARTFRSAPHTVPDGEEPGGMGPFDDWEFE